MLFQFKQNTLRLSLKKRGMRQEDAPTKCFLLKAGSLGVVQLATDRHGRTSAAAEQMVFQKQTLFMPPRDIQISKASFGPNPPSTMCLKGPLNKHAVRYIPTSATWSLLSV